MIRARSTRLVGSVRDREISCKRCRCSASVGSAITRRGATTGSPNPIPPPRLLPHLAQHAKSNPNILIFWNLYTSNAKLARRCELGFDADQLRSEFMGSPQSAIAAASDD